VALLPVLTLLRSPSKSRRH